MTYLIFNACHAKQHPTFTKIQKNIYEINKYLGKNKKIRHSNFL